MVSKAIEKAERFRTELLLRGILLVPVILGEGQKTSIERKGFGVPTKAATSLPSIGVSQLLSIFFFLGYENQ